MGELLHKVKQLDKRCLVNLHRHMLSVKHDTMLVIVHIRGILEAPAAVIDGNRNNPVVLPGRMIQTSGIPFILHTEQTFRVTDRFRILRRCNRLGILLRLGKVDGDVNLTIRRIHLPLHILFHTVTPDIIAVLTESIIVIRSLLRRNRILPGKCLLHLRRSWH